MGAVVPHSEKNFGPYPSMFAPAKIGTKQLRIAVGGWNPTIVLPGDVRPLGRFTGNPRLQGISSQ